MERSRLTDPADPRLGDAFALYESSFPVYERRTRAAQAARLSHPEYHFDLLMEGERFLGILLFWEADGFRYVEHFATCPQLRGQGVGTRALAQLNGEGVPVVLEIDLPRDEVSSGGSIFMSAAASSPTHTAMSIPPTGRAVRDIPWW